MMTDPKNRQNTDDEWEELDPRELDFFDEFDLEDSEEEEFDEDAEEDGLDELPF